MSTDSYVVCGCKSWNRQVFDDVISEYPGDWHFIGTKEDLTVDALKEFDPRFIFFLHWSWKVPNDIVDAFECVNFHMADVPYGRGGSPLQNLILLGHNDTRLSALRMTDEMDAGPVYLKEDLSLEGTAQQILERACELSAQMIGKIIEEEPTPVPQEGEVVLFERRTPEQSEMPPDLSPAQQYDFIRMLDGEGYPPAFVIKDGIRYEYRNARLHNGNLEADITPSPEQS